MSCHGIRTERCLIGKLDAGNEVDDMRPPDSIGLFALILNEKIFPIARIMRLEPVGSLEISKKKIGSYRQLGYNN